MNRTWQLGAVMLCASALAGCKLGDQTTPSDDEPLRITTTITQSTIPRGETATITFRLENISPVDIRLFFNSSCQLLPYISDSKAGFVVYPAGGNWACAQVITELTLKPGGAVTQEVRVRAPENGAVPGVSLSPGDYETFARLDDLAFRIRSVPLRFTVQ
jgi:hypothetical protein